MEKKKIRFDYFEVVYKQAGDKDSDPDRLFDLRYWIAAVNKKSTQDRIFDYGKERISLNKAYHYDSHCSMLHFLRMSDTDLPLRTSEQGEVEPLNLDSDEYLSYDITGLYDEEFNILMLQRNRLSLGPSRVENYMNLIWGRERPSQRLYLRPILAPHALERIRKAGVYRKMVLRFADIDRLSLHKERSETVKKILSFFKSYGAINAEITLSVGHRRKGSLHKETVYDTMANLEKRGDFVKKAEVYKKDSEDTFVEPVDLFEDRAYDIAYFDLERKTVLPHEKVAERMFEIYNERREQIIKYLNRNERED